VNQWTHAKNAHETCHAIHLCRHLMFLATYHIYFTTSMSSAHGRVAPCVARGNRMIAFDYLFAAVMANSKMAKQQRALVFGFFII
jgi:hypothetical protein